ncbi:MAG: hypothetical protein ACI8QF_000532, partial [Limisphaerales bacterium]
SANTESRTSDWIVFMGFSSNDFSAEWTIRHGTGRRKQLGFSFRAALIWPREDAHPPADGWNPSG